MATAALGVPRVVITDHGSENLGEFSQRLRDSPTKHYFARVRQPKDKPFIERLIGTLERECLSLGGVRHSVLEQQEVIDKWLTKYHYYRPHASLNYLTPYEFIRHNSQTSRL